MCRRSAAAVCDSFIASMIWFIATARRTFVCFSSASGNPRSAKTLPELRTMVVLLFLFAISNLVIFLRSFQPLADQSHVRQAGLHTFCRLLLEGVKHINCALKSNGVNRPIRIASMVFYDFEHSRAFTFPWFCLGMLSAKLSDA